MTNHAADDFAPVLSPNGQRLAFISRRTDAAGDVHILDLGYSVQKALGSLEGKVLDISSPTTEDSNPSWFPSGKKLVLPSSAGS